MEKFDGSSITIAEMQKNAWQCSDEHGFHEGEEKIPFHYVISSKMDLIHTELAEATEEIRSEKPFSYRNPEKPDKPEGVAAELADVIIRCGDLAGILGIDLQAAVIEKMNYNITRPFRNGGKIL